MPRFGKRPHRIGPDRALERRPRDVHETKRNQSVCDGSGFHGMEEVSLIT
jgi:hypothetical protein